MGFKGWNEEIFRTKNKRLMLILTMVYENVQ